MAAVTLRRLVALNLTLLVLTVILLLAALLGPAGAARSAAAAEPGVPVVFVATGQGFPDALAGGPLGALNAAPLLFVTRDVVPAATRAELVRLAPLSIVILGGEAVVSAAVEDELQTLTTGPVTRIAGTDRFDTAARIAQALPSRAPDAELLQGLGPDAFAAAGDVYTKSQADARYVAQDEIDAMVVPRAYGRVRVIGVIPSTSFWDMAFDGPHPGFLSARTPGGGVTCLKPDPAVLTPADVSGGFLTDASGNDTRLYFNGSFGCDDDEVRVVQKSNFDGSPTNQSFNVLVP
jgi:hypothetical protein